MKTKETTIVELDKIDPLTLPELASFKEKSLIVVKENPYVEIIDNPTYELAKKARTNLRSNRTALQNQEKAIKDKLNGFKKKVENVTAELIAITEPHEIKQQTEVTRYEDIKEQERQEKARIEQERIDGIKAKIKSFADLFSTKIENLTFAGIEEFKTEFDEFVTIQPKDVFQEFEVLYDDMLSRITYSFSQKKAVLIAEENNRLEQIRLTEERAENERKQGIRNLIQEWNNNWSAIIDTLAFFKREETFADFKNEKALDCQEFQSEYAEIRNSLVQKFESKIALLQQIEDNRIASEKLAKEKADFEERQRKAKYQERIKMLADAGCTYFEETNCFQKNGFFYNCDDIRNSSDELFERELQDAKNPIVVGRMFTEEPQEVVFEEQPIEYVDPKDSLPLGTTDKIEEIANNDAFVSNYHEEDVDVKGIIVNDEEVVSESIKFESLDELTWIGIYNEWSINHQTDCLFVEYLEDNFLVPERKK